jgi:hypothetical protein
VRCLLRNVREDDGITQLYFFHIDFTDSIIQGMQKLLVRDGRRFSSIKLLSCSGNMPLVATMIMDHSSTESLTLSNSQVSAFHAVNESLRTNQSLKVLRISGSTFLSGEAFLDGLEHNCTLKELDMCRNHLSKCAVESLSHTLSKNQGLEILKLESCDLEDHAMAEVIRSLLNHTTLTELDLSNNAASSEALEMVAQLIQRNRIQTLSINSLLLSDELDPAILLQAIASLQTNTSLSYLDISGNHFSDEIVQGLAKALCVNSTLETLDVSESDINETGVKTFAKHLPRFSGMKVLNLAENDITEEAALALVAGLEDNRLLQSLGPIEEVYECTHFLEHYLDLNLAGRRALQNDISLGVWPHLLARTAQAELCCGRNENALFSLLRGPALFER